MFKKAISYAAAVVLIAATGCEPKPPAGGGTPSVDPPAPDPAPGPKPDYQKLDAALASIRATATESAAALAKLPEADQIAVLRTIAGVEILTTVAGSTSRQRAKKLRETVAGIGGRIPEAKEPMRGLGHSCLDEHIAYASAMSSCYKDGKDEDECPSAWSSISALMACEMAAIEDLRRGPPWHGPPGQAHEPPGQP